jgi:osmotically inducible protein OsmC
MPRDREAPRWGKLNGSPSDDGGRWIVAVLAERTAHTIWKGNLTEGQGELTTESSGVLSSVPVTWASRTEEPRGRTSPEELLAAAQAACFAMAFSNTLDKRGTPPDSLDVRATCTFERTDTGVKVGTMRLDVRGTVPDLDQAGFEEAARAGVEACPVSNAIRGNVQVELTPELVS